MATSTTDEPIVIDIEVTNRCNAKCHFCPRDETPHEGLMTPEVFDQALRRAEEYRRRSPPSSSTPTRRQPLRAGRAADQQAHAVRFGR